MKIQKLKNSRAKFSQFYGKCVTLLLLCLAISGFGQKADPVFAGPVQSGLKGYHLVTLFGESDDVYYALRENRRKKLPYVIQKMDADSLTVLANKTFKLPSIKGDIPNLESVLSIGGKNYLLATTHESDNDTVNVLAFEMLNPLNINKVPRLLAGGLGEVLSASRGYRVFKDPNHDVFTLVMPLEGRGDYNEKFEIRLFDQDLNLLQFKTLEIPYRSNLVNYEDAMVDSSGAIYVLTGITNLKLTTINQDRNIGKDYSLFKYSWADGKLSEKSLSLGTKWLYDVSLTLNTSGNLQVVGYYSNMVDLIMAGTFSVEIDRDTGEILNQGLSQFDRDFRVQFRPSGSNITETQLGKFKLNDVIALSEDRTMLISEKNYTETSTVFNPATGTYSIITVHNLDEILITVINPSSRIAYNLVIPKYQSSTRENNDYTSFIAVRGKENTYIIYNDDRRNTDLGLKAENGYRQLTSASNSEAILITISDSGNMSKTPLFNTSDFAGVLNPNLYYQTSGAVIVAATSGHEIRYFKIKLN